MAAGGSANQIGHRRADIQGLRAFAVLVVIAFHAGLPVPGGFVGVDVFFVISGFVITGMLHREYLATGAVRLRAFYARRVTRLIPALAVVVGATVLAATFLLSPLGLQQLTARTGAAAMVFVANFQIAISSGGYFEGPAERNPLLNLWSLSVEEQFYFVFPFVLVLGWWLGRRLGSRWIAGAVVLILGIASYLLMLATVGAETFLVFVTTGFYSPLSRAWEFAVGALLALVMSNAPKGRWAGTAGTLLGAIGVVMLFASLWLIGPATPFPSSATLLPVVGAALVILAGSLGSRPSMRVWSLAPLTYIGDRSYSLYLWHWPLIVFAAALWPLTPWAVPVAALVSVAPALLSFRYVEQRFRHVRLTDVRSGMRFGAVTFGVPILLCVASLAVANQVWRPMYDSGTFAVYPEPIGEADLSASFPGASLPCADAELLAVGYVEDGINHCLQSKLGTQIDVAVLGDSHAEHLYPGIAAALPELNVASYFHPDTPISTIPPFDTIFAETGASTSIDTVILNSYWARRGVPVDQLIEDVRSLVESGKRVIITNDVPGFPFDPEVCKYRKAPVLSATDCTAPREVLAAGHDVVNDQLQTIVDAVPGAELVDTWDLLCDEETCSMTADGALLYRDSHHLNAAGSAFIAERILEASGGPDRSP